LLKKVERSKGSAEQLCAAAHLMSFYDPNHAEACKLRGFVEHNGVWVRPNLAKAIEAARDILDAAPVGDESPREEDYVKMIQASWHRRVTPRVAVRTVWGEEAAKRSMRVGNATIDFAAKELGEDPAKVFSGQLNFTRVKLATDWNAFVDAQTMPDDQKELRKKLTGTSHALEGRPIAFINRSPVQSGSDDMWSGTIAINVLRVSRKNRTSVPLFYLGFCYYSTGRLLGTTSTKRYTLNAKKEGTSARHGSDKPTFGGPSYGPAFFRNLAKWNIAIDNDPSLAVMAGLGLNEFFEDHACKAFSLFEYLMEEHREKTLKWLKIQAENGKNDLDNLAKELGTDLSSLEIDLKNWIWKNY
ncbi:MAG: hypothetical protein KDB07_09260, partial [Planctomycetes bacterium]|nr:hypothetical protein [Planctomycetota bacterium]